MRVMKAKDYLKARVEYDKVFECGDWMYGVYGDKFHFTDGVSLHSHRINHLRTSIHFAANLFDPLERLDICVTHIGLPEELILFSAISAHKFLWSAELVYTPSDEWFVQGGDVLTLSGRIEDGYAFLIEKEGESSSHVRPFLYKLTFIDTHELDSPQVSA